MEDCHVGVQVLREVEEVSRIAEQQAEAAEKAQEGKEQKERVGEEMRAQVEELKVKVSVQGWGWVGRNGG